MKVLPTCDGVSNQPIREAPVDLLGNPKPA